MLISKASSFFRSFGISFTISFFKDQELLELKQVIHHLKESSEKKGKSSFIVYFFPILYTKNWIPHEDQLQQLK